MIGPLTETLTQNHKGSGLRRSVCVNVGPQSALYSLPHATISHTSETLWCYGVILVYTEVNETLPSLSDAASTAAQSMESPNYFDTVTAGCQQRVVACVEVEALHTRRPHTPRPWCPLVVRLNRITNCYLALLRTQKHHHLHSRQSRTFPIVLWGKPIGFYFSFCKSKVLFQEVIKLLK